MDGSDDYEFDELDEATLATLDRIEQAFLTQAVPPSPPKPPPSKRQKTTHDFRFKYTATGSGPPHDFSDDTPLPEVSLQPDGSYRVGGAVSSTKHVHSPLVAVKQNQFRRPSREITPARVDSTRPSHSAFSSLNFLPPQHNSPQPGPSPIDHHRQHNSYVQPHSTQSHAPIRSTVNRDMPMGVPEVSIVPEGPELSEMRRRLDELQKQNDAIQKSLAQANEIRMAREGEVTILRKNLEKNAQDHAAQLAKLKQAREESEAKRKQAEKEAKDEMERMKTQLMFQQHELTSARIIPGTQRTKRVAKELPGTPMPTPSQFRAWNQDSNVAGPSHSVFETPRKPERLFVDQGDPNGRRVGRQASPEMLRKSSALPGFENAFAASSPSRRIRTVPSKPCLRDKSGVEMLAESTPVARPLFATSLEWQGSLEVMPPSPSRNTTVPANDFDIPIAEAPVEVVDNDIETKPVEELDIIQPTDWKAELSRIISTHNITSSPTLTVQLLIQAGLEPVLQDVQEDYSLACASILRCLATSGACTSYETDVFTVANSLISLVAILSSVDLMSPLVALLNLLNVLSYSLPRFTAALLTPTYGDSETPRLVHHLHHLVALHLDVKRPSRHKDTLGNGILTLFQALCWNVPEDLLTNLASIPANKDTISALIHHSQPDWLLIQSVRLLTLLATHPKLFRPLFSLPEHDSTSAAAPRSTIVDWLSYLLCDNRQSDKVGLLRQLVIQFFGQALGEQADAIPLFFESHALIPAVVTYLSSLATPIWEDDELLMSTPTLTLSYVEALGQALAFLYCVVFGSNNATNLLAKLKHATPRYFNGVSHVFIVTFGRLSYADPPEWLDRDAVAAIERLVDMARDLIELVVDGPEGDAIWAVYQSADESEADEEEMEAELLGNSRGD